MSYISISIELARHEVIVNVSDTGAQGFLESAPWKRALETNPLQDPLVLVSEIKLDQAWDPTGKVRVRISHHNTTSLVHAVERNIFVVIEDGRDSSTALRPGCEPQSRRLRRNVVR
jgi:hypothetical protein